MTYAIVCLLTAAVAWLLTWLLCRKVLGRLGMWELGVKEILLTVRNVPGEGEYVPRCGGLLLAAGVFTASLVMVLFHALLCRLGNSTGIPRLSGLQSMYIWAGLAMTLLVGAAGFMDDYALVFRKLAAGLTGWQRLLIQAAVASAYLASLWLAGVGGAGTTRIPFVGEVQLGFWFYPVSLLLILAVVDGARRMHEADGAVPAVGFFALLPYVVVAGIFASYNAGMADMGILAVAGACGCLAFLPVNHLPAQAHTGAAGGAFMGALLCAVAFAARMPLLLLLSGGVYIAESLTALIGWVTEKLTGKAAMVPLHRMIGRRGKNDAEITAVFSAVTAVLGAAAAALAIFEK